MPLLPSLVLCTSAHAQHPDQQDSLISCFSNHLLDLLPLWCSSVYYLHLTEAMQSLGRRAVRDGGGVMPMGEAGDSTLE